MIADCDIPTLDVSMIRHPRRRLETIVCCEECGSRGRRYSWRTGQRMAHWVCSNADCGFHWKEPAEVRQP